jgi:hypothetical protein
MAAAAPVAAPVETAAAPVEAPAAPKSDLSDIDAIFDIFRR